MHGATQSRLDELRQRIAWYEALQRLGAATIEAQSLEGEPAILIQARVSVVPTPTSPRGSCSTTPPGEVGT